jgi:glucose/mannose-6-phosphate isomerase
VCVYGAAGFPAVAARRWKGQVNENAKTPAFHGAVPEMNHNEIVGFEALADLHPRFAAVFLREAEESPRVARRIVATRELLEAEGVVTHEVSSRGRSRLARLLSLVVFGDWVSLYLGVLAGVDPTPIAKIDRLKAALSEPAGAARGRPDGGTTP